MSNRLRNSNFTMDDIASELGLSKSTVSRALSDSGRISAATRERVQAFAKEHGFKPNLVAKALASKKTFNIAVALPLEATALQMMFYHECLSGIVNRAARDGYSVLLCMTENEDNKILEDVLENRKVDSVVLTQLKHDDKNVALLKKYAFPFVVIGSSSGEDFIHVDSRMKEYCADFTKLCVKNLSVGSQVLFVCASLDVEANNNRLSGFLSGMEELGENFQYAICTDANDMFADDVVCIRVLEILRAKKIEIGKDVKIASFHDSILLENHSPAISALKVDAFALGEKASELSLKLANHEECENVNFVDCSFMMRESTN